MMELVTGQIVTSRAGRDVTRAYVVVGMQGERVLLADGQKRTLQEPKHKNTRHLMPTRTVLTPEETATDMAIKKALAAFNSRGAAQQGG